MTAAPGSDPHPEVTEISDLTEDLLAPERAAEVRRHLADCPQCAEVLSSLTEISDLLGSLPAPEPMPAEVADRIDAALAAEAAAGGGGAARVSRTARADVADVDVPRGTSTGGGGTVPRGTSSRPDGRPAGSTGPGRTGGSSRADGTGPTGATGRRGRRRVTLLTAGWALGALVLGGVVYGVVSSGGGSTGKDSSMASSRAGSTAQSGSVAQQVRQLLADPTAPLVPGAGTTMAPNHGNTPMLGTTGPGSGSPSTEPGTVGAPLCVLKGTHRTEAPLAVGRDEFEGSESYLVVLPHPSDSTRVDAYVVSAACSGSTPGALLFQASYPRQ